MKTPLEAMHLRLAREADLPVLAALYARSVRQLGPQHYTAAQVRAWAAFAVDADGFRRFILGPTTFVAEEADALLGFAGIAPDGHVTSLYVHDAHGRRGIGTRLLQAVLEHARTLPAGRLYAEASVFSRPLFEKFGFAVYATERVERGGVPFERYLMQRVL